MSFFYRSIQRKIIGLVCLMILLSQATGFLVTYFQINSSQEAALKSAFGRTELLVSTLFSAKKERLENQASMLASLPLLQAVAASGDEDTIIDSANDFKERFNLDVFEVIDLDADVIGDQNASWNPDIIESILDLIDQGAPPSGFLVREDQLMVLSSSAIGTPPNHSGYLLLGVLADNTTAKQIADIANSDILFASSDQVIAKAIHASDYGQVESFDRIPFADDQTELTTSDYIYKAIPLKGLLGDPVASMVMRSSFEASKDLFSRMVLVLLIVAILITLVFAGIAYLIGGSISRPIKALNHVTNDIVGQMNFKLRAEVNGRDEVASLGESFNRLVQEISLSHEKLEEYNKTLERRVQERTETINTILDNVSSGFCLVDDKLVIDDGFTRSCKTIIGEHFDKGERLSRLLKLDDRSAEHFEFSYLEAFSDVMPEDVVLSQAPSKVQIEGRTIGIQASVVRDQTNSVKNLLFNLSDITPLIEAEKLNDTNRTLLSILGRKDAFIDFIFETKQMIQELRDIVGKPGQEARARMLLHTIKGNCGISGLKDQADLIHKIEDKESFSTTDIRLIEESFREFLKKHTSIINLDFDAVKKPGLHVTQEQLKELSDFGEKPQSLEDYRLQVADWLESVQMRRADDLFASFQELVERVSERLMKTVHFIMLGGETLLNPSRVEPVIQVIPHIVRNCLDHGIEAPWDRGDKDEDGTLELRFEETSSAWHIMIRDDGAGIPADRLVEKSLQSGALTSEQAASMTHEAKLRLIFADGVSTAEAVSDVSGRGVGMAAVLEAVEKNGGELILHSELGKGTQFTITVPKASSSKSTVVDENAVA